MFGSAILGTAVGLVLLFAVTALLCSGVTEMISNVLQKRAAMLLRGLRSILDAPEATSGAAEKKKAKAPGGEGSISGSLAAAVKVPGNTRRAHVKFSQSLENAATAAPEGTAPAAPAKNQTTASEDLLVTSPVTIALFNNPLIQSLQTRRTIVASRLRNPSYIPARTFARALIDMLVPKKDGELPGGEVVLKHLAEVVGNLPPGHLKASLQALLLQCGKDLEKFTKAVEDWYDAEMDRVSGWYKRYVAKITLVVGAILVLLLNINTLTIGRTLYSSSVIGTAVSSVAAKTTSCPANESTQKCLGDLQAQLSAATQAGLPIGWAAVSDCAAPNIHCNWLDQRGIFSRHGGSPWQVVLVLIGFLATIIALTPGARFWFDLLGKLGSLRSTGPKPPS